MKKDPHKLLHDLTSYLNHNGRHQEFFQLAMDFDIPQILKRFKDLPHELRDMLTVLLQNDDFNGNSGTELKELISQSLKNHIARSIHAENQSDSQSSAGLGDDQDPDDDFDDLDDEEIDQQIEQAGRLLIVSFEHQVEQWVQEFSRELSSALAKSLSDDGFDRLCEFSPLEHPEAEEGFADDFAKGINAFARERALLEFFSIRQVDSIQSLFDSQGNDLEVPEDDLVMNLLDGFPFPIEMINTSIREATRTIQEPPVREAVVATMTAIKNHVTEPESSFAKFTRSANIMLMMVVISDYPAMFAKFAHAYLDNAQQAWRYLGANFEIEANWLPGDLDRPLDI